MKNSKGKMVGILGTVIVHLIAGIVFMSFEIKSIQRDISDEFMVEFAPAEETPEAEKLIELPVTRIEKIFQGDEEMLNIARNLSNKADVKINPADYIDMVKEELIKSGKLSTDNYIDEMKNPDKTDGEEKLALENQADAGKVNQPDQSQEMASNYKGLTRIYYDLPGRTHTYLPLPIYKCQGSGKIVLSIQVNQRGIVEKALIIEKESNTSDQCLIETAVATALISRFNSDNKSTKTQTGTLSYHFVSQ